METNDPKPTDGSADLEEALRKEGDRQRALPVAGCPSGSWVLGRIPASPDLELDEEVTSHLAFCPACRELALCYREALDARVEAARRKRAEAAVRDALRGRPPAGRGLRLLLGGSLPRAAVAASIALVVVSTLFLRGGRGRPELLGPLVPVAGDLTRGAAFDAVLAPGGRFRIRGEVRRDAVVYGLLRCRLTASSTLVWLSPPGGPATGVPPASFPTGSLDLGGSIPGAAVAAQVVLLAIPGSLAAADADALGQAAERREPWRALSALARRLGGEASLVDLFPADPRGEFGRILASEDPDGLRSWIDYRPEGAASVAAALLEEGLGVGGGEGDAASFEMAERIGRAWEEVRDSGALLERVEWARALARSPERLARVRALDREIRREVPVHDQNATGLRGGRSLKEACLRYRRCAEEYGKLGDLWGVVECLLREAWSGETVGRKGGLFREAEDLSRAAAYPRGWALALFGRAYQASNAIPTSQEEIRGLYGAAARILREIGLEEPLGVAMNNLGQQAVKHGALGEAFASLEEAVRTLRKVGARRDEAIAMQNLARALEAVGRAEAARSLFEESGSILRAIREASPEPETTVRIYEARAAARASRATLRLGDRRGASERSVEAEALARGTSPVEGEALAWALQTRAEVEIQEDRFAEAERTAAQAAEATPRYAWRQGESLLIRGRALRGMGRTAEARREYEAAREKLQGIVSDLPAAADVLDAMADLEEAEGKNEESIALRSRWLGLARAMLDSQGLSPPHRASLLERLRPGFVAGVRLALALDRRGDPRATPLALQFMEGARPRSLVRISGRVVRTEEAGEASLVRLLRNLPAGATWLEYLHGESTCYLFAAGPGGTKLLDLGVPAEVLEGRATDLGRAIVRAAAVDEIGRLGRAAWEAWLAPVSGEVASSTLLVVSLDPRGPRFPFEAVVAPPEVGVEGAPAYLVRRCAVVYAPSLAVLAELDERGRAAGPAPRSFLALGDPGTTPGSSLPGARAEVEEAARLFGPDAEVRLGREASESFAKSGRLAEFRVLHIAGHAGEGEEPALRLAPAPGEDGFLTAAEIADLPPLQARLVTLAACGSAASRREEPPWEGGLPAAFLASGAASVLSALGPVSDASSRGLMARFDRELAGGSAPAAALRAAKLALLLGEVVRPDGPEPGPASPSGDWRHPCHWSPFVLDGDAW